MTRALIFALLVWGGSLCGPVPIAAAGEPPLPKLEAWGKRYQAFVRQDGADAFEQDKGWQASLIGRLPIASKADAVLRLDTKPQPGQLSLGDPRLWQSVELLVGGTWTAKEFAGRLEAGPAVVGGLALAIEDVGPVSKPAVAFGGVFLRDRKSGSFVYVGGGRHEATNGKGFAVMATAHLALFDPRAGLELDFVTGQASRIVLSVSARLFKVD